MSDDTTGSVGRIMINDDPATYGAGYSLVRSIERVCTSTATLDALGRLEDFSANRADVELILEVCSEADAKILRGVLGDSIQHMIANDELRVRLGIDVPNAATRAAMAETNLPRFDSTDALMAELGEDLESSDGE